MECDHSGSIMAFLNTYPDVTIVASAKAFTMLHNFHEEKEIPEEKKLEIKEGDTLNLGKHELAFVAAPMVHWPEVMMTYDAYDKVLFAADGFGKFGANDVEEDWACEARRYYIGIVGKYGQQVQNVLKKAAGLEIETICSLHGPVLKGDLSYYINLYDIWSSYEVETEGSKNSRRSSRRRAARKSLSTTSPAKTWLSVSKTRSATARSSSPPPPTTRTSSRS